MSYNAKLAQATKYLFPISVPKKDWLVVQGADGPFYEKWTLPTPVPTEAEIDAAVAAMEAKDSAVAQRLNSFKTDSGRLALVAALASATPAEIDTYVRNNIAADSVATQAQAIKCLKRIETSIVRLAQAVALVVTV